MIMVALTSCKNEKQVENIPANSYQNTSKPLKTLTQTKTPLPSNKEKINKGIKFEQKQIYIDNRINQVFILTVDLTKNIKVLPYLSFNKIYGFETLSDMAKREAAYAAITSGFYYMYGRPSGLVVNNGKVLSAGTGRFNSLIIEKDKAYFEKINTKIFLTLQNKEIISIDTINAPIEKQIQSSLYTRDYGKTDRLHFEHIAIHILDNTIMSIKKVQKEEKIPDEGYLVCFRSLPAYIQINKYDFINITIEPIFKSDTSAYECSKMIVENKVNVACDYDPWIGNLDQYDPRTCVGINENGNIIFVVVDGRQKDYSIGVTGKQLADICIDLGLIDVAMLDGGASAQMLIEGETMNRLSYKNEQRPLAGGFLIFID